MQVASQAQRSASPLRWDQTSHPKRQSWATQSSSAQLAHWGKNRTWYVRWPDSENRTVLTKPMPHPLQPWHCWLWAVDWVLCGVVWLGVLRGVWRVVFPDRTGMPSTSNSFCFRHHARWMPCSNSGMLADPEGYGPYVHFQRAQLHGPLSLTIRCFSSS